MIYLISICIISDTCRPYSEQKKMIPVISIWTIITELYINWIWTLLEIFKTSLMLTCSLLDLSLVYYNLKQKELNPIQLVYTNTRPHWATPCLQVWMIITITRNILNSLRHRIHCGVVQLTSYSPDA